MRLYIRSINIYLKKLRKKSKTSCYQRKLKPFEDGTKNMKNNKRSY